MMETSSPACSPSSIDPFSDYDAQDLDMDMDMKFWIDVLVNSVPDGGSSSNGAPSNSGSDMAVPMPSSLDKEWGYVLDKYPKSKKRYSSSAVCSTSDLSEALSDISAALSLSLSSHSSGERDEDLNGPMKRTVTEFMRTQKRHSQEPSLGMVFPSEEEAFKFYKTYAASEGFSVRKGKVQRLSDGTIRKRFFLCSRQGFRSKKQSNKTTKFIRKETRTGCDAGIQYTVENGKWVISRISLVHNHLLKEPEQTRESCTRTPETNVLESSTDHFKSKDAEDHSGISRQSTRKVLQGDSTTVPGEQSDVRGSCDPDMEALITGLREDTDRLIWKVLARDQATRLEELRDCNAPLGSVRKLKLDPPPDEVLLQMRSERNGAKLKELLGGEHEILERHYEVVEKDNVLSAKNTGGLGRHNNLTIGLLERDNRLLKLDNKLLKRLLKHLRQDNQLLKSESDYLSESNDHFKRKLQDSKRSFDELTEKYERLQREFQESTALQYH